MSTSRPDSSRKQVRKKEPATLRCRICDKPVEVMSARIDSGGSPVHEECYALKLKLEQAGQDGQAQAHSTRPWNVIAVDVSRERDAEKMTELVAELNQALDEQNLDGTPKSTPDGKSKPESK
jgi:hypothetical protein